jgi:NTE family protein
VPVAYFNMIGGTVPGRYMEQQIPFVGINNVAAMKNILTMFRTDYRFTLMKNHYITGILNYARDCDAFKDYAHGLGYFGAAVEYSFDTIFGPISANVHWSNINKSLGIYLSAGYTF